jgi:hypothetical protein
MLQQQNSGPTSEEGNIVLAIQELNKNATLSVRLLARDYLVPRSTLRGRRAGVLCRADCKPKSMKLTETEESAIIQHILELDGRGFPPTKSMVRQMANKLLAERQGDPVGKKWPDNFVNRVPDLKTRRARPYDRQRALCEDPIAIGKWFELARLTKEKYGILDDNT